MIFFLRDETSILEHFPRHVVLVEFHVLVGKCLYLNNKKNKFLKTFRQQTKLEESLS